ncbi:unnamed protein product [Phaeothamnion confervicola]
MLKENRVQAHQPTIHPNQDELIVGKVRSSSCRSHRQPIRPIFGSFIAPLFRAKHFEAFSPSHAPFLAQIPTMPPTFSPSFAGRTSSVCAPSVFLTATFFGHRLINNS